MNSVMDDQSISACLSEYVMKKLAPTICELDDPEFQQAIYMLIECWCDYCEEDIDSCIQEIQNIAELRLEASNSMEAETIGAIATEVVEIGGSSAVSTHVIEISERER